MNMQYFRPVRLVLGLLAAGLAGTAAQAGSVGAYLPTVGPAPLRFELAMARTFAFPKPPVNLPKTNAVASTEHQSPPAIAEPVVQPPVEPDPQTSSVPDSIGESVTPMIQHASAPASDMLMVTPQMLAEYLKPSPGATNANVSVLVPFSFMPPLEKEHPSSRATYQAK